MNESKTTTTPVVPVKNCFNNTTINVEPILRLANDRAAGNFQDLGKRYDDMIRELVTSPDIQLIYPKMAEIMFMLYETRDAFLQVTLVPEGGES